MSGGRKPPVMNGYGNLHVRCQWNGRSGTDAGDGLVTISASQSIALHDMPQPRTQRGKGKEVDSEIRAAAIWKQTSKKRDTAGDNWRS